ncbi:MAG: hypothetical protein WC249_00545 [Patescibacteria group bacterium]|jgi:hypothetical protein
MVNNNFNNKTPIRPRISNSKIFPRLSLNLHTMPQSADSHFKKWLFLALFIFALMILGVFIIFWH